MKPHEVPDLILGDSSPEAFRVQYDALRKLPPWRRLELWNELTMMARSLTRAGLRQRHPDATEAEIDDMFADLTLGSELAAKVREYRRSREGR